MGMELEWKGTGVTEQGVLARVTPRQEADVGLLARIKPGQVMVEVDAKYFRPTEVDTLLGDPTRAKQKLGWSPRVSFGDLVAEMVREDLAVALRDQLCRREGFRTFSFHE